MNLVQTDRLTLVPQTAQHAAEMYSVLNDPAIYEFENIPPVSIEWLADRFSRLETRCSPDGTEQWLNWVIRLPELRLIGYVQATIDQHGGARIAYEMSSAFWGRGLATEAVDAMIHELSKCYRVFEFTAVYKSKNQRSRRLLDRLGFIPAIASSVDADESSMRRRIDP